MWGETQIARLSRTKWRWRAPPSAYILLAPLYSALCGCQPLWETLCIFHLTQCREDNLAPRRVQWLHDDAWSQNRSDCCHYVYYIAVYSGREICSHSGHSFLFSHWSLLFLKKFYKDCTRSFHCILIVWLISYRKTGVVRNLKVFLLVWESLRCSVHSALPLVPFCLDLTHVLDRD